MEDAESVSPRGNLNHFNRRRERLLSPVGLGNMFCKKVFYETFCSNERKLFERREYDVRAFLIKFQY